VVAEIRRGRRGRAIARDQVALAECDGLSLSLSLSQARNSELRDAEFSALISRIARETRGPPRGGVASLIFRTLLRDAARLRSTLRRVSSRHVLVVRFPPFLHLLHVLVRKFASATKGIYHSDCSGLYRQPRCKCVSGTPLDAAAYGIRDVRAL